MSDQSRCLAISGRTLQSASRRANAVQSWSAGGGGAGQPWHRSYDGKPPPAEFQGPDFVTYAGLTLPKRKVDADYFLSKGIASIVW